MLKVRVIPCLDVKDGRVVKGVNFVSLRDAGGVIGGGLFDRITGVAQRDEIHALHHAAVLDVQAGDDANRQHQAATFRASSGEIAPL